MYVTDNLTPIFNIPAAVITPEQACGSIGEVIAAIGSAGHGKHFDGHLGWIPAWKVKVGEYEQEFVIVDINPKYGFVDVRHRQDRKWKSYLTVRSTNFVLAVNKME